MAEKLDAKKPRKKKELQETVGPQLALAGSPMTANEFPKFDKVRCISSEEDFDPSLGKALRGYRELVDAMSEDELMSAVAPEWLIHRKPTTDPKVARLSLHLSTIVYDYIRREIEASPSADPSTFEKNGVEALWRTIKRIEFDPNKAGGDLPRM